MATFPNKEITYFAETDYRNKHVPFGIKSLDRDRHMYVIGKTGMGKSTLLENLAIQDIQNGHGIGFIDPHGGTAERLLEYVPKERINDVIYFAPHDTDFPIAFNVMEDVGKDQRHLVANGLMAAFKKIWPDVWSARMEYISTNIILALLEYPDSTLIGINRMLSDKAYRKKVVDYCTDPVVKSFWVDEYAKYSEKLMVEAGSSIQNKFGQFVSNPLIRNIVGQPKSTFDLRKVMDEKKILIMNLSKGRMGEINANLIGGMLITKIYLASMSRASESEARMKKLPPFYFFVDEFQSFVNDSFKDILSEARKYKLALTIAHQYVEQVPEEVRNAVFGNVGTTIAFRVGPFDAEVLEKVFAPKFVAEDLVNLGFAQIYLTLMIDGVGSPPFSAKTLPGIEKPDISYAEDSLRESRSKYARPRNVVEKEIQEWHETLSEEGGGTSKIKANPSQVATVGPTPSSFTKSSSFEIKKPQPSFAALNYRTPHPDISREYRKPVQNFGAPSRPFQSQRPAPPFQQNSSNAPKSKMSLTELQKPKSQVIERSTGKNMPDLKRAIAEAMAKKPVPSSSQKSEETIASSTPVKKENPPEPVKVVEEKPKEEKIKAKEVSEEALRKIIGSDDL